MWIVHSINNIAISVLLLRTCLKWIAIAAVNDTLCNCHFTADESPFCGRFSDNWWNKNLDWLITCCVVWWFKQTDIFAVINIVNCTETLCLFLLLLPRKLIICPLLTTAINLPPFAGPHTAHGVNLALPVLATYMFLSRLVVEGPPKTNTAYGPLRSAN